MTSQSGARSAALGDGSTAGFLGERLRFGGSAIPDCARAAAACEDCAPCPGPWRPGRRSQPAGSLAHHIHRRLGGSAGGVELGVAQIAALAVRLPARRGAASSCSCRSARAPWCSARLCPWRSRSSARPAAGPLRWSAACWLAWSASCSRFSSASWRACTATTSVFCDCMFSRSAGRVRRLVGVQHVALVVFELVDVGARP